MIKHITYKTSRVIPVNFLFLKVQKTDDKLTLKNCSHIVPLFDYDKPATNSKNGDITTS